MKGKPPGVVLGMLLAVLVAVVAITGTAQGMYLTDGAIETAPGVYANPQDGVCVVGLKFDGTLDVNTAIDNARDCAVYTTPTIKALASQAICQGTAAGNDGFKHAWTTSICVDNATTKNPISRVNLDNDNQMCAAKGGIVYTAGLCVAYGWQYMGVKSGETLPYRSTITPTGYKGRTAADNLGFCYATMRMTSVTPASTVVTCASQNNLSLVCAGGANQGMACTVANQATTCPASTCVANAGWSAGTDNVLYQSQASYDAGLGWAWDSGASNCNYTYGVKGYLNAAMTNAAGVSPSPAVPLCAGGTGAATAGTCVNLTQITTMGDCLAAGGNWDNWLPTLGGIAPGATAQTVFTTPTLAFDSTIMKLDATTPIASGGGKFYSGTGSVCLKCHADQSRAYAERNKPAFIATGHKLAGDTPPWTTVGSTWGLKGVQCEICHATGKPTAQDVGVVVYSNTTGTNAGLPRAASGHNQTEYGSHVNGVCYFCHGTPAAPTTSNPAAVIPVSGGDFALTSKNLAPISNQFLNSPHAKYSGDSRAISVNTKGNYDSHFIGYICRAAIGMLSSTTYPNSAACTGAGFTWYTTTTFGSFCYYNAASCASTLSTNLWTATFDPAGYPWAADTGGPGGVCYGIGQGSILTTVYQSGAAGKIPNLGTSTNAACTNFASATPSGAGGFWLREGESPGTANGVAFTQTDQGNCMTCHDVHWSLDSTNPEAEPLRRECGITCHADKANWGTIKHPLGPGTPIGDGTNLTTPCEICHMPLSSATGQRMHLWRINTSSTYSTMGASAANLAADGTYATAAWVDLDKACGQCHGGSAGAGATANGAPYYDKAYLSVLAQGMHAASAFPPTAAHTGLTTTNLVVSFTDASRDNNFQPQSSLAVTVNWGDGQVSTGVGGAVFSHTYASGGKFNVLHTVKDVGNRFNSEFIAVSPAPGSTGTPPASLTVKVFLNGGVTAVPKTRVYLKKETAPGSNKYGQILFGYTDAAGQITFGNLAVPANYKVAVYKSAVDFNGDVAGKQSLITSPPIALTANSTVTFTQGAPATPAYATNGQPATITVTTP